MNEQSPQEFRNAIPDDHGFNKFQDRIRNGKIKLCKECGGVMLKSSRMILSAGSAVALVILGLSFMSAYGATRYLIQAPEYFKFALPALYYIGSLFLGSGIMFFFIREKIWVCEQCRDFTKRVN
jgi:hypothetical protein